MNLLNKLTTKNLTLNKKRTIVTIIGIILSVALITAVASMYASGIQMLIIQKTIHIKMLIQNMIINLMYLLLNLLKIH